MEFVLIAIITFINLSDDASGVLDPENPAVNKTRKDHSFGFIRMFIEDLRQAGALLGTSDTGVEKQILAFVDLVGCGGRE